MPAAPEDSRIVSQGGSPPAEGTAPGADSVHAEPGEMGAGGFFDDPGLPDSHVMGMPIMVPHRSDGTTDVLVRGRHHDNPALNELTEPLFPRQKSPTASDAADDNDITAQLPRQLLSPPASIAKVVVASQSAGDETLVMQPVVPVAVPAAHAPPSTPAPVETPPTPVRARSSGLGLILLISYASAMTIAVIFLLLERQNAGPDRHQLEDLRDPVDEDGNVRIFRRDSELPPGHVLTIGESRQFGHIRVEVLRVTREPVEFTHYSGDAGRTQAESPPVLKLWLKLTNTSADQQIAPLDALLLYKREMNTKGELVSNTFLAPVGRELEGPVVFNFPIAASSEWDLAGQNLSQRLAPGESRETYIPSDTEGIGQLSGELVWRLQLRKGYAPSGKGVTTLVDFRFHSRDIVDAPDAA
jgi:hypothetical protein